MIAALLLSGVMFMGPGHARDNVDPYTAIVASQWITKPTYPQGGNYWWRGGNHQVVGFVRNGEPSRLRFDVVQSFTDSCGVQRHLRESFTTLDPHATGPITLWAQLPMETCVGWGTLERYVAIGGDVTFMAWDFCKALSVPFPCRARLEIPVYVSPSFAGDPEAGEVAEQELEL